MSFLRLAFNKITVQLGVLMFFYTLFRISFFAINHSEIAGWENMSFLNVFIGGLRFDLSAIAFLNCFWILLTLIFPLDTQIKWQKILLNFVFYAPNIVAFLFELSDWVYFNYIRKRATFDVFDLVLSKGDFLNLLPNYIVKFWMVPLLAILAVLLLIWTHKSINKHFAIKASLFTSLAFSHNTKQKWLYRPLAIVITTGLIVVAMRGGMQLMPINPRNAIEYVQTEQAALVLNTPFSIITTYESAQLQQFNFMSANEADVIIKPIKKYHEAANWQKKNVAVIVWESFSKRYTSIGGDSSVTPFFDSLSQQAYLFNNAYANALRSNEGVPSIFSGIPALMEGPMITSSYSNNRFTSLPQILDNEGYQTVFYHGGNNGTMSLDTYGKTAGFQSYVGREQYGMQKDYDGTWGVWDMPFLQYVNAQMDQLKTPFMAGIFTLSSHIPYKVPEGYKARSLHAKTEVDIAMDYTDFALQQFFETAKRKTWYANTIFVITADHGCPTTNQLFYTDGLGRYQIPILIFDPSSPNFKGIDSTLVQQIDIFPSILDYIGYNKAFFSLGNSAFDKHTNRFYFSYLSNSYSFITNGFHFKTTNTTIDKAFRFPEDMHDTQNVFHEIENDTIVKASDTYFKAFLQLLHDGMINDKLNVKTYQQETIKP